MSVLAIPATGLGDYREGCEGGPQSGSRTTTRQHDQRRDAVARCRVERQWPVAIDHVSCEGRGTCRRLPTLCPSGRAAPSAAQKGVAELGCDSGQLGQHHLGGIDHLDGRSEAGDLIPDPRPGLATTSAAVQALVATVKTTDLSKPTPCEEFDVQALLDHIAMVFRRSAAIGNGDHWSTVEQVVVGQDVESYVAEIASAAASQEQAWADSARLAASVDVAMGGDSRGRSGCYLHRRVGDPWLGSGNGHRPGLLHRR